MAAPENFSELKRKSGKSWADLERDTGIPSTTIRNHVTGKVAQPNPQIVGAAVAAMQDAAEMASLPADLADLQDAAQGGTEETRHVIEMMRRTRSEMLELTSRLYDQQIAQMQDAHAAEVAGLQKSNHEKDLWIKRLVALLLAIVLFFVVLLSYDLLNRDVGWFRAAFDSVGVVHSRTALLLRPILYNISGG